jgi:hypothetical protein
MIAHGYREADEPYGSPERVTGAFQVHSEPAIQGEIEANLSTAAR